MLLIALRKKRGERGEDGGEHKGGHGADIEQRVASLEDRLTALEARLDAGEPEEKEESGEGKEKEEGGEY